MDQRETTSSTPRSALSAVVTACMPRTALNNHQSGAQVTITVLHQHLDVARPTLSTPGPNIHATELGIALDPGSGFERL